MIGVGGGHQTKGSGTMADYIDKQKTLNVIFEIAENVIKSLPSADVQPVRHGFWIEDRYNDLDFVCSECGEPCANMVMGMPRDRYCKWCGARMDGERK